MNIAQIEATLQDLKNSALIALGVSEDVARAIPLADAPDPKLGDRGFPVFALAKALRKGPPMIAQDVTAKLQELTKDHPLVAAVIAAGPYVNFALRPAATTAITIGQVLREGDRFGHGHVAAPAHWMVEFSAPNTNKPQHLGHVRNNLLGNAVTRILSHAGNKVTRVNLINDRGIHICKSMLAYQLEGDAETPETSGIKGDHLVGKYYVMFERLFQAEYAVWQTTADAAARLEAWRASPAGQGAIKELGPDADIIKHFFKEVYKDTYFNTESALGKQARDMLIAWEAGDEAVVGLWRTMNSWVFAGFDATYKRLGIQFEEVYYESNTYKLGKDLVYKALDAGILHKLDNGAIACDLTKIGLSGDKVLMRGDGTSVYMTQDLGTAMQRFEAHDVNHMVYVVGDEQNYHFQVLFGVLGLLDERLKGRCTHLSYGMVELPDGKMKSRQGNVVDADDLMSLMAEEAAAELRERFPDLDDAELARRAEVIGLAAIKYFILDFNPRTTVHFDPKKSLEFTGRTGPYALYTYARIQSIGRELGGWPELDDAALHDAAAGLTSEIELALVRHLGAWLHSVHVAARDLDPSKVTEHIFHLCKAFNLLYNDHDHRIKPMPDGPRKRGLLALTRAAGLAIAAGLELLGIERLETM